MKLLYNSLRHTHTVPRWELTVRRNGTTWTEFIRCGRGEILMMVQKIQERLIVEGVDNFKIYYDDTECPVKKGT